MREQNTTGFTAGIKDFDLQMLPMTERGQGPECEQDSLTVAIVRCETPTVSQVMVDWRLRAPVTLGTPQGMTLEAATDLRSVFGLNPKFGWSKRAPGQQ